MFGVCLCTGKQGKRLDPRIDAACKKYLEDNTRLDSDNYRYYSGTMLSFWQCFVAHVDSTGTYHVERPPEQAGQKNCVSYSRFTKYFGDEYKEETWESCCCQMCFQMNQTLDKLRRLINIAHDPYNMNNDKARGINVVCNDPHCKARSFCNKAWSRDVITDEAAAANAGVPPAFCKHAGSEPRPECAADQCNSCGTANVGVPYLFCKHAGSRPRVECALGHCDSCGWKNLMPQCAAIENYAKLTWTEGFEKKEAKKLGHGSEFYDYIDGLFVDWLPHIHICIHQRDQMHAFVDSEASAKTGFGLLSQIDFSEAARHERNHGGTLDQREQSNLLVSENTFYCHKIKRMTTETGAGITADALKDAYLTHKMLCSIWDRYKAEGRGFKRWVIFSDGGPAHFKNKDAIALSSHLRSYCGVPVTFAFHQSHHGKL